MFYRTKKEFLEHVGKNGKDTRWIDRAIVRGTVVVRGGGYSLTSEYLEELESKGVKEEKKVEKSESSSSGEIDAELLNRFSLVWNRNKKKMDGIKNLIQSTYNRYGGAKSWEESIALVYKGMGLNEEDFVGEEDEMARDKEKYRIKEE